MLLSAARSVGDLQRLLRGIPENTPLRILAGDGVTAGLSVGYGTDPTDLSKHIVIVDANQRALYRGLT